MKHIWEKIVLLVCIVLGTILLITACESPAKKLVGNRWIGTNAEILEFFDDGTYRWGIRGTGIYDISKNRLKLDGTVQLATIYIFTIKGDTLILEQQGGGTVYYLEKLK